MNISPPPPPQLSTFRRPWLYLWFQYAPNKDKTLYLWMENWFQNWFLFQRFMAFERQAAENNPFMFSEFLFSRNVFFPINLGLSNVKWLKYVTKQHYSSDLWPLSSRARLSPIIQSRNNIINNYDIKIASSPMSVQIRGGGAQGEATPQQNWTWVNYKHKLGKTMGKIN
jgi:hypothetical protein